MVDYEIVPMTVPTSSGFPMKDASPGNVIMSFSSF